MTLYTLFMLFAGLGLLIYAGVGDPASVRSTQLAVGLQVALFASLAVFLATVILLAAHRFQRAHAFAINGLSRSRGRLLGVALVFLAGGTAVLVAATRGPGDVPTCGGQCGGGDAPNGSQAAVAGSESARALAAGRMLFEERGCVACHRPDGTGAGPTLHGLFGSPVQYPGSGTGMADETYLREAILNPSVSVAMGFTPVMPTFAGQVTDDELQALIVYVKSLSEQVQIQGR